MGDGHNTFFSQNCLFFCIFGFGSDYTQSFLPYIEFNPIEHGRKHGRIKHDKKVCKPWGISIFMQGEGTKKGVLGPLSNYGIKTK